MKSTDTLLLHTILLIQTPAIDAQTSHGVTCAADRGHPWGIMCGALRGASEERVTATTKLLVELLLEGLAQQVKGKGVEAGVGEGQDTSYNTAHEVNQGGVHLVGGVGGGGSRENGLWRKTEVCVYNANT